MKIGLIHKRLDLKGGTERDLYRTAEGLRDRGHEVHLFCSEYGVPAPEATVAHRVPVIPFGRTARLWSFALRAPNVAAKVGCDVVVGFGRIVKQDVLRSGGGSHRDFLQRLGRESGWRRRAWQNLSVYHRSVLAVENRQFRAGSYKKVLAVSAEVKRDLMTYYGVPDDKITVLYNGVDQTRFNPDLQNKARAAVRQRWRIPAEAVVVLFVGSGFQRKGLDRLLSIWNSPKLKKAWLLVVGDDARVSSYKASGERVGRVVFTGRQTDVENYYGAADVLALPAVQEAFGNVILEALSSGLPVLVSSHVGAAEVLSGALLAGVVDHPEDPAELESKLAALIKRAGDPELKQAAGLLGAEFSWPNHFRKLETFLLEVSESGHRRSGNVP